MRKENLNDLLERYDHKTFPKLLIAEGVLFGSEVEAKTFALKCVGIRITHSKEITSVFLLFWAIILMGDREI